MQEITLTLSVEEVNLILTVLGELPSKTGAWPLILKIQNLAQAQLPSNDPELESVKSED